MVRTTGEGNGAVDGPNLGRVLKLVVFSCLGLGLGWVSAGRV